MNKIILMSTYFGKYPDHFHLWLKSAAANPEIDFLLIGDCDIEPYKPLPENIRLLPLSFEEMRERVRSKFDFDIVLEKPYKLCDYKPAYGYIFEEEISAYDYWGHIDIDTILGDIKKFLPEKEYQKIYLFGHLCIYRNTFENNRRFMCEGAMDYKEVYQTSFNMIFDELPGMNKKFRALGIEQYEKSDFADIARRRLSFTLNDNICAPNHKYQIFYYDNGHVYRDYFENGQMITEEFNYIHFSHRNIPDKTNGSDSYFITRFGFIEKSAETTIDDIKRLNAPTPVQDIYCSLNTQVIRRVKRIVSSILAGNKFYLK